MPDTYTDNLQLVLPEVGASRDSWGAKLSSNFTTLDEFVSMAMPVGVVADFAGPNPPPGWLACDGRQVSRTTYSQLFAAIGTAWGAGDGSTTFNLPPANGRAAIGAGSATDAAGTTRAYTFAQRAGSFATTILQTNLPNIVLTSTAAGSHAHGGITNPAGSHTHTESAAAAHAHGGVVTSAGFHDHAGSTVASAGDHTHTTTLPSSGTGAAGGATSVVSSAFGNTAYVSSLNGAHTHSLTIAPAPDHNHAINPDGGHTHTIAGVVDHTHIITADGSHGHNVSLGGGGAALEVVQPVMVVTKIIYAGAAAAPLATGAAVPLVRRLMSAPLRGSH